ARQSAGTSTTPSQRPSPSGRSSQASDGAGRHQPFTCSATAFAAFAVCRKRTSARSPSWRSSCGPSAPSASWRASSRRRIGVGATSPAGRGSGCHRCAGKSGSSRAGGTGGSWNGAEGEWCGGRQGRKGRKRTGGFVLRNSLTVIHAELLHGKSFLKHWLGLGIHQAESPGEEGTVGPGPTLSVGRGFPPHASLHASRP